jgi:hypothetical protein
MTRTTFKTLTRWSAAMLLAVGATAASAQEMPSTASASLDRGVGLARQGQWSLALKYFRSAHEEAPDNPATLLNLGLVYDRMGGHEGTAIAWLKAYLAAAGGAANAQQVRSRVGELDTQFEVRVQRLVEVARQVSDELSDPREKGQVTSLVLRALAEADDIAGAIRVDRLAPAAKPGWGVAHIAAAYARKGNVVAAMNEAQRLESPLMQSWALAEIAVERAKRKDVDGAVQTAASIKVKREAAFAFSRIAVLRARAGDAAGAEAMAARVEPEEAGARAIALAAVAAAQSRAGDRAGATKGLAEVHELQSRIDGFAERMNVQAMVATAKAALAPDLTPLAAVQSLPDGAHRDRALRDISALRGDLARAEVYHWASVAHEIEDTTSLGDTQATIDAAKTRAPGQTGLAVATVAYEAARALAKLRE